MPDTQKTLYEVFREEEGLDVNDGRCPYCGKRKRGWRKAEPQVLCADCDRRGLSA